MVSSIGWYLCPPIYKRREPIPTQPVSKLCWQYPKNLTSDIVEWCRDTGIEGEVIQLGSANATVAHVIFEREIDAIAFKLRWFEALSR